MSKSTTSVYQIFWSNQGWQCFSFYYLQPREIPSLSLRSKRKKKKNKKSKLFAFICLTCEPFFCVFCRCWFHSWFSSLLSQHNTPTNTWQQAITRSAFQKQMRYKNRKSQKVQLQHGTHGSSGVITVDRLTPVAVNIIRQGRCLISQYECVTFSLSFNLV